VFIWFQELRYQIGAFQEMTKWSWPNVKIIITTGVYLTRVPSGPNPRPNRPRGRLAGRPGFKVVRAETWLPHVYTRRRSLSWWRQSVEAAPLGRLSMWLGRPAGHHVAPNWPLQVGGGPIHTYKYSPHGESRHTHHTLEIPLAKLSFLV
jgi:hypothetical protein